MILKKKPFENTVRKGENAVDQHFLLFPQCFQPIPKRISGFSCIDFVVCKCFPCGPVQKMYTSMTLKAVADKKLDVAEMIISIFFTIRNVMVKGGIGRNQYFCLFVFVFKSCLFQGR